MKAVSNRSELLVAARNISAILQGISDYTKVIDDKAMDIVKKWCSNKDGTLKIIEGVEDVKTFDQYDAGKNQEKYIKEVDSLFESEIEIDLNLAAVISKIM